MAANNQDNNKPDNQPNNQPNNQHSKPKHSCSHGHHHHHHHAAVGRIQLAFFLNLLFAIVELIGGIATNSMAVLSDAVHDLGDACALGFAWYMEKISIKKGDQEYSYGFRRFSTASAVVTGVILLVGSALILSKAIPRLLNPEQPKLEGMILLAILGVIVNGWAAFKVSHGSSISERMITWHLIEDVLGWVLVLISAIVMWFWTIPILDSALAILLALWVVWNVFKNLKEAMRVFLQAVPSHLLLNEVVGSVQKQSQVHSVHHPHLWSMDGEQHIFTAHVVVRGKPSSEELSILKSQIKKNLQQEFHISEAVLEIELESELCLDPEHR